MRVLIFGNGRVGGSFALYSSHLGYETRLVTRLEAASNRKAVGGLIDAASLIAAAIPDDYLAEWRYEWRERLGDHKPIHFSGALQIEGMRSYHPLYSFPPSPLDPATMGRISIAREEGAPPFSSILPGATNPEFTVSAQDRPYYHALAVLSGNFAAHLWNEAAQGLAARFGLAPGLILGSYLEGVVERFRESPMNSMTGPVARRDRMTVEANLAALDRDPHLKRLYLAFLESAWPGWRATRENSG